MNQEATRLPVSPRTPLLERAGYLLLGLLMLALSVETVWTFGAFVVNTVRARWWVSHPCTLATGEYGDPFPRVVHYTWDWNGREYRSNLVYFLEPGPVFHWDYKGGAPSNTRDLQAVKAAAGKPGAWRCWVNPENPAEAVLHREMPVFSILLMALCVTILPLIAAGGCFGSLQRSTRLYRNRVAKKRHPHAPLLWREDWSSGCVDEGTGGLDRDQSDSWCWSVGIFVAAWVLAIPGLSIFVMSLTDHWTAGRIIVVSLASVGFIALLCSSVRHIRRVHRFGYLTLILDTVPLAPGQILTGQIPLPRPLTHSKHVRARLTVTYHNDKHTMRSRRVRSRLPMQRNGKRTKVLAKSRAAVEVRPEGLAIRLTLPDASPVWPVEKKTRVTWTLRLRAPGGGIRTLFELPVWEPGK